MSIQSAPQPRPGGRLGRGVTAVVNAFEVQWNVNRLIHHYDVITPKFEVKPEWKLGKTTATEVIARLQDKVHPNLFPTPGAFDGIKNFFSVDRLDIEAQEFKVPLSMHPKNKRFFSVRMTHVREIDYSLLRPLLRGDRSALLHGSEAITALNLFFQMSPRKSFKVHNEHSVFFPQSRRLVGQLGVEIWPGLFQSVRPVFDRLVVNVDFTSGVVLPEIKLEHLLLRFLKVPVHEVRRLYELSDHDIKSIKAFFGRIKIMVDLPAHEGKRQLSVLGFVRNAGTYEFEKDGQKIKVADHFKRAHNYAFHPHTPGVKVDKGAVFPVSVCKVSQQLFKHNSNPDIVNAALSLPPNRDPPNRFKAIMATWDNLAYTKSQSLLSAGIAVNREPMKISGRILNSPNIQFSNSQPIPLQRPGAWNLKGVHLHTPGTIRNWIVLNLVDDARNEEIDGFLNGLIQVMRERNINLPSGPLARYNCNGQSNWLSHLRKPNLHFALVILPINSEYLYRQVKRVGNISAGVITQCVKWTPARGQTRGSVQYNNNLVLKINAKIGGVNFVPRSDAMSGLAGGAMVVGADVSHPGVGSAMPSIVAMVSSFDSNVSQYATSIRLQEMRTEIIADIEGLIDDALEVYFKKQNKLPNRIVYLRDGVSEGEYETVKQQEVRRMIERMKLKYAKLGNGKLPQIHCIVVSKRHHIRFMSEDQNALDREGNQNLKAGFVVDQGIVHPVHGEFYLQSQPGLKGTSRPTRYVVLHNDGLNIDQLQDMIYSLCYCYSRSTRSVKVPAPVYYADLVCRKAKIYYDDAIEQYDTAAHARGDVPPVKYFQDHFEQVHDQIKETMHFV